MSIILLLSIGLAGAITQQEAAEAKSLIDSKIACDKLADNQLEIIGEYYMEQMHPGEAHNATHEVMGIEEGSAAEMQFHINLARTMYCGDSGMMGSGSMMGMMNMSGMMGNYQNYGTGWVTLSVLSTVLIIGLIILVYLAIIKLGKDLFHKKK